MTLGARHRAGVLYVEDEASDRLLMERAFAKEGLGAAFRTVPDGQAAIDYLSGRGLYAERDTYPVPSVVLLDLHLPGVHGFDVLKWIRTHPLHRALPVVVFSSYLREDDQARARALGADDFMTKPSSATLLRQVARTLHERWLKVNGASD